MICACIALSTPPSPFALSRRVLPFLWRFIVSEHPLPSSQKIRGINTIYGYHKPEYLSANFDLLFKEGIGQLEMTLSMHLLVHTKCINVSTEYCMATKEIVQRVRIYCDIFGFLWMQSLPVRTIYIPIVNRSLMWYINWSLLPKIVLWALILST